MSGLRLWSVSTDMPPEASICIMSDVPERGKPETIVIIFRRWQLATPYRVWFESGGGCDGRSRRRAHCPGLPVQVFGKRQAKQFQNRRGDIDDGGLLIADLTIAEKNP